MCSMSLRLLSTTILIFWFKNWLLHTFVYYNHWILVSQKYEHNLCIYVCTTMDRINVISVCKYTNCWKIGKTNQPSHSSQVNFNSVNTVLPTLLNPVRANHNITKQAQCGKSKYQMSNCQTFSERYLWPLW